jgi:hypothetical protein
MAAAATKLVFNESRSRKTINQVLTSGTDISDWVSCQKDIAIQVTGPATNVIAVVERSTIDPSNGTANPAPISSDNITGNPSTGITVGQYYEPGSAWWRVRLTTLTGPSVNVSITTSGE